MSSEIDRNPLISIIVITYNSAKFVWDTLESAKAQTYQNIELIISDDCSADNTVEICKRWLEDNKFRFFKTELITVKKNTGIPANCNRGVNVATGDWIKLIAGDDILLENCLSDNYKFVKGTKKKIVISNMISFTGIQNLEEMKINYLDDSAEKQFQYLLKAYWGNSPTYFVSKEIYKLFTYDENIKLMEDYPFALNATKNGEKIYYLDKATIRYRVGHESVYGNSDEYLFHDFFLKLDYFNAQYRYPYMKPRLIKKEKFDKIVMLIFIKFNLRKRKLLNRILYKIAMKLNPY